MHRAGSNDEPAFGSDVDARYPCRDRAQVLGGWVGEVEVRALTGAHTVRGRRRELCNKSDFSVLRVAINDHEALASSYADVGYKP